MDSSEMIPIVFASILLFAGGAYSLAQVFTNLNDILAIKSAINLGWKSYIRADDLIEKITEEMTFVSLTFDHDPGLLTEAAKNLHTAVLQDINQHIPALRDSLHRRMVTQLPPFFVSFKQYEDEYRYTARGIQHAAYAVYAKTEETLTRLHSLQNICGFSPLITPKEPIFITPSLVLDERRI